MLNAPEGYNIFTVYTSGSNMTHIRLLVCLRCGSLIGGAHLRHNKWHEENDEATAVSPS